MPQTGIAFEKEKTTLTKRVLDFFERVRYSYLSARENPSDYGNKWKQTVKEIREQFDSLDDFTRELKRYLKEDPTFSDEAYDPTSRQAKEIYESIKRLRFKSDKISDPFSKQLGDDVIQQLLKNESLLLAFVHYAVRSHTNTIPEKSWKEHGMKKDEITQGYMGLDLEPKDVPIYIIEHYGDDKSDTRRIETKVKKAFELLEKIYLENNDEEDWDNLLELDISKADDNNEKKSKIDFILPNKPMYRIFELDDLDEVKGLTGEFVVQEKYDGMRIQIHKFDGKVKIYSYNEKDITSKCPKQVKHMEKKSFNDCILDAELMLFLDDEPLHRADTITHVFHKKTKGELKAHVFDVMLHEGKKMLDTPLRERINILLYQYAQHSSEYLAFPSKKDTRIADSKKEVGEYAKDIMKLPSSEGVVIKDIESTYYVGSRKNPKWIKWKKFVDLDVVVLNDKTTKSNLHSYTMGIGPVTAEVARNYTTVEFEDKAYLEVGKALNTKIDVPIGSIVRVKVDEVTKKKNGFSLYSAKVIEIPEVTQSDNIATLEQLASKTKKSLQAAMEYVAGKTFGSKFKIMSGVEAAVIKPNKNKKKKKVKKSYYITDNIHGTAEIILKEDLNGYTIFGFEGDNLMQKNALHNIDLWKEQLTELMKSKRSELRISISNEMKDSGKPEIEFADIVLFVRKNHKDLFESLFDSDNSKLMNWMKKQDSFIFKRPNLFVPNKEVLEKDVDDMIIHKEESREGNFKIVKREDGNVDFIITFKEKRFAWLIDIEDTDDIYNLFGKSNKYPAIVSNKIGEGTTIDEGKITLGVQKDGYHEYKLEGDKFETRIHVRVVPINEKNTWVVWTGKKQKMLDDNDTTDVWNIKEDKYSNLDFPPKNND
jgi:ATP-dependent DNA ligase|tara:strand:- start:534 stop:3164 length:2631 start_codon:yes stop_codon:yes gene_type:complete